MLGTLTQKYKNRTRYPRQFWLLLWGTLITRAGVSMTWPFVTIFITQKLGVPLAVATLLLTVQSIFSIAGMAVIGPLMDRFGRKGAMVAAQFIVAAMLIGMGLSEQLGIWIVLMAIYGAIFPVFITGTNTMVADLVEEETRTSAYALTRMSANFGIAVGPIIGGIVALHSIETVYFITATIQLVVGGLMVVFIAETIPKQKIENSDSPTESGYRFLLRDRTFLSFGLAYILVQIGYTQMFMLLPIYSSENFGLQPEHYSLLFTVNASMVVLLQYSITLITMRYRVLPTIAVGALFYALGIGSVALGSTLPAFLLSMAVMTIGELIIAPTATAYVARIAPLEMRARYMGIFGIAFPVAMGIGPVIGGYLSDNISPVAIWYGAGLAALVGAAVFLMLARREQDTVDESFTTSTPQ